MQIKSLPPQTFIALSHEESYKPRIHLSRNVNMYKRLVWGITYIDKNYPEKACTPGHIYFLNAIVYGFSNNLSYRKTKFIVSYKI